MKKIFIASDHAGFKLKNHIYKSLKKNIRIIDLGTNDKSVSVNYPEFAHKLCKQVSKNNSNVIVFNGEIYNYEEIKNILKSKGIKFYTEGDTEVLLEGYNYFGKNILNLKVYGIQFLQLQIWLGLIFEFLLDNNKQFYDQFITTK